ncbi:hypothetical protein NLJ89_g10318 [Agrocybe chaxingu]|uniref:Helicase C-terminal domain-containing protein n=1 Tax=Agrocybe chaxingu TaxID=84603 RepID=A0A9W8JRD1_9AGAR|nr:hypothetical protein NLJ89_g10318 [Agrocybe chaxingu]
MFNDCGGAPWGFPAWQDITGLPNGPFSDPLPDKWTRADADAVLSYFDAYRLKPREEDKIKFAAATSNADTVPGRKFWKEWINRNLKNWQLHSRITDVFSSLGVHPVSLALADPKTGWPDPRMYTVSAMDGVGLALFGPESLDALGHLLPNLRPFVNAIMGRCWNNHRNSFNRSKKRIELDREKLTKASLRRVIIQVAKWKVLAEALQTTDNLHKITAMEEEIARLMIGIGAQISSPATKKPKLCKISEKNLLSLASEEDVADVIALYREYFDTLDTDENDALEIQHPAFKFTFSQHVEDADPGVEVESAMTPEELAANLGFINGLPLLFNTHRHTGGLTPWTAPDAFEEANMRDNPLFVPIALHWHQAAGVHAQIRMIFSKASSPGRCTGALVADEVGLGKTFQAAALIASLADMVLRQTTGTPLPPIIQGNPFVADIKTLPIGAHLLLVPGTLLSQCEAELRVVLNPKAFDILVYPTNKAYREMFWYPSGPFHLSQHKPSNRIIIASHSALHQDFGKLFQSGRPAGSKVPWTTPERLPGYEAQAPLTLFGQKYLSTTLDEGQNCRNNGAKHSSVLAILALTLIRIIMTATPLQTSTKDLAAMGRLVGIRHFLSEKAFVEEKQDTADLRRAKRELPPDYDPLMGEDDPIKLAQVKISLRLQSQFEDRVLRRTIDSKNWAGEPLIKLPPCTTVTVFLDLTPRELAILNVLSERVKDSVSTATGVGRIISRSFYIEYRMGVGYARQSASEAIPKFNSLTEWEEHKSTKFDVCARMCKHLLARDDAPPMIFEDGNVVFPPIPSAAPGEIVPRETKILIYQEFPSLGPLLRDVLKFHELQHLYIDGQTSFDRRAAVVARFLSEAAQRILIISSVGSFGLNLSRANKIIFLDQPWSAQDERQIRGRAHRQPQTKEVTCYHLLGNNTADVILSGLARGKRDMMEAFLKKETGQELFKMLSGKLDVNPDDDLEEGDPEYDQVEIKEAKAAAKEKEKEERAKEKEEKARVKAEKAKQKQENLKKPKKTKKRTSDFLFIDDLDDGAGPGMSSQPPPGTETDNSTDALSTIDCDSSGNSLTDEISDSSMASALDSLMGVSSSEWSLLSGRSQDSFMDINETPLDPRPATPSHPSLHPHGGPTTPPHATGTGNRRGRSEYLAIGGTEDELIATSIPHWR